MKHFAPFVLLLLFFGGAAWVFLHPVATAIKPEKQGGNYFISQDGYILMYIESVSVYFRLVNMKLDMLDGTLIAIYD